MDQQLKKEVLDGLRGALAMVGQAQNECGLTLASAKDNNAVATWNRLGKLYDAIDCEIENVEAE